MSKPDYAKVRRSEESRLQKAQEREMRKRQRVIRITETPLLPAMLSSLYACMKVFTLASLAVTLLHALIHHADMTVWQAAQNMAISGSLIFMGFAVLLLLGSGVQLLRLRGSYTEYEYGFEGAFGAEQDKAEPLFPQERIADARLQLYRRTIDAKKKYGHYVKTSAVGIVVCLLVLVLWRGLV